MFKLVCKCAFINLAVAFDMPTIQDIIRSYTMATQDSPDINSWY